jgi:hypothetical protein
LERPLFLPQIFFAASTSSSIRFDAILFRTIEDWKTAFLEKKETKLHLEVSLQQGRGMSLGLSNSAYGLSSHPPELGLIQVQ